VLPLFTGVTALANAIPDMRALSSLNLASNNMQAAGAKHIAQAISQVYCSDGTRFETAVLWGSTCRHCGYSNADHDNGALSKLDVRKNNINAEGKSALKKAAGVGVSRSRCVQLKFLSFSKAAFNSTCSFPVAHAGSSFDSNAPLTSPLHRHEICSCEHTGVHGWRKRRTSYQIAGQGGLLQAIC
jgi:hypothetical protein